MYLKIENKIPLSKCGVVVSIKTAPAAVLTPVAEVHNVGVAVMYSATVSVTVVVTAAVTLLAASWLWFLASLHAAVSVIMASGVYMIMPATSNKTIPPKPRRALQARTSSMPSLLGGP